MLSLSPHRPQGRSLWGCILAVLVTALSATSPALAQQDPAPTPPAEKPQSVAASDSWLCSSSQGKRIGWVHWQHHRLIDAGGKVVGHVVRREEMMRSPLGDGSSQLTRVHHVEVDADWKLVSFNLERDHDTRRYFDEVSVTDGKLSAKRTTWLSGDSAPDGTPAEPRHQPIGEPFDYVQGSQRVVHPFQLADTGSLEVGASTTLHYIDPRQGRAVPVRYRVRSTHYGDSAVRVAGDDPEQVRELVLRSSDGAPLLISEVGSNLVYHIAQNEAEAKDMATAAIEPDYARGLGLAIDEDQQFTNYANGYRVTVPGLPWMAEQVGSSGTLALSDPTRELTVFFLTFGPTPPGTSLDSMVSHFESAHAGRYASYEPAERQQAKLGEVEAMSVSGLLTLPMGKRDFRHVYALVEGLRPILVVIMSPTGILAKIGDEIDGLLKGFTPIATEKLKPQVTGNTWREPRSGYVVSGPGGDWRLVRQPDLPGAQPHLGPAFRFVRKADDAFSFVTVGPAPFDTTIDELVDIAQRRVKADFQGNLKTVTTEVAEIGGRVALRLRAEITPPRGDHMVVLRSIFIDSGKLLIVHAVVTSAEADEKEIVVELDVMAASLRPWKP